MKGIILWIVILQLYRVNPSPLPATAKSLGDGSRTQDLVPQDDEVFAVTDDNGVPFVVSMNDIIQSLSALSDQEIIQMLQTSEPEVQALPAQAHTESEPNAQSQIPLVKHENLDNIDENDVVLIENEDGDIRLLTVNDVLTSYGNVDLKHHQVVTHSIPPAPRKREVTTNNKPQVQKIRTKAAVVPTKAPAQKVDQPKVPKAVNSNVYETIHSFAPNSPPVKLLDVPGSLNSQHRNTISITTTAAPTGFGKGIRDVFSRLVSRVMGDNANAPKVSQEQGSNADQYVQIVMPSSDPYNMEQIRIPLPKPIHYTNQNRRSFNEESTTPPARSFLNFGLNPRQAENQEKSKNEKTTNGPSTRQKEIFDTAKIPQMVQKKVFEQMKEQPLLLAKLMKIDKPTPTNRRMDTSVPENEPIDRIFRNKKSKKTIQYKYEFPSVTVIDHPPPPHPLAKVPHYGPPHDPVSYSSNHVPVHYGPPATPSHYAPHPIHAYEDDEDQPLVDISFLADITQLAKYGKDNESYSFPRIGDPSKFVEVRDHKH